MSPIRLAILGIYLGGLYILAFLLILAIWPRQADSLADSPAPSDDSSDTEIYPFKFNLSPERRLLLIVALMGVLGAASEALWNFSSRVGSGVDPLQNTEFTRLLVQPLVGSSLSMIVYLLLRGGIITGAGASKEINVSGIAGMAGLVGFFAFDVARKLASVVTQLLGK